MQDKVQQLLNDNKLDGLLITNQVNIFYLTGFKGVSPQEREALLVIGKNKSTLITARLYQAEASKLKSDNLIVKIATERNEYEDFIKDSLQVGLPTEALAKVGFEAHDITVAEHKKFRLLAKKSKLTPTNHLIENLRAVKTEKEIEKIEKAQNITSRAFTQILKTIKIGQTEAEISEKLKSITWHFTHQSQAFEPIVASGPNSAKPHHVTSDRRLVIGDTLLFDFGAKYQNYCADFSRTVFIGKASGEQRKIFNLVLKAQKAAIANIKPKIKAKAVFESAAHTFKKVGVGDHFLHSLGHGIGLQVHEGPSLGAKSKDILERGMIFSVEPGLYFKWGGVRLEDLVVVGTHGAKVLGRAAKFIEIK
ncbi:MAG: Xaa-Pro peptidase family protein [Patescibacteria group bacterium]